jgi:hypothetical protein
MTSTLDSCPVLTCSLRFVASVLETDPLLVDLHGTAPKRYILPTTLPTLSTGEEDQVKKPTEYTLVAVFDRSGRYIYTGTNRGHFNVIDAETREVCIPFSIMTNFFSW